MNGSSEQALQTKNGYYYGTTRGKSWWRRYTGEGWLSRGNSEVWVDGEGLHFRRYMTKETKHIPFHKITGVELGRWHAGKWTGLPVLKIHWRENGLELVSGFSFSRKREETNRWIQKIKELQEK